jgi:hypothetical protein
VAFEVIRAGITAVFGVFLLSSGVQGWFMGGRAAWFLRAGLIAAALCMIEGGWISDLIGHRLAVGDLLHPARCSSPRPTPPSRCAARTERGGELGASGTFSCRKTDGKTAVFPHGFLEKSDP